MGIEWLDGSVHPLIVQFASIVKRQSSGDEHFLGAGTARTGFTTQTSRSCCDLSHPKNWNLKITELKRKNYCMSSMLIFHGVMIRIIHISS